MGTWRGAGVGVGVGVLAPEPNDHVGEAVWVYVKGGGGWTARGATPAPC